MKNNRFLGAVLLIAGTSIGAGTLALPVITAQQGFPAALLLFGLCWAFMTLAALFMLEVSLSLPPNTNLVSMAKARLGTAGTVITWLVYLLLLYALMMAYTEGASDLFIAIGENLFGISIQLVWSVIGLLSVFALVLYCGTRWADWLNRLLMLGLIITFLLVIYILFPHVNPKRWLPHQFHSAWQPLPVLVTTFGYQVIIPSLRNYLQSDARQLQRAIILGGLIPLLIYCVWELLIFGALPLIGHTGLLAIQQATHTVPELTLALHKVVGNNQLSLIVHLLLFFFIGTSLVGVALALLDFLLDTPIKHLAQRRLITIALTFIPPGFFALFFPSKFVAILSYGGLLVAILLILLPALMVISQRYFTNKQTLIERTPSLYRTPGGLISLLMTVAFAGSIIVFKFL